MQPSSEINHLQNSNIELPIHQINLNQISNHGSSATLENDKIQLVHDCLYFQHRKQKYLFGITYLFIGSNFILKNKVDHLIIPSHAYVNQIYLWAALSHVLENQQVSKTNMVINKLKKSKIVVCSSKQLEKYYPNFVMATATPLKQHEFTEQYLISMHRQFQISHQVSNPLIFSPFLTSTSLNRLSQIQIVDWLNCQPHQLKVIVPEKGTSTYLCQGTELIAVDPSQQFVFYLSNNSIVKEAVAQTTENKSVQEVPPNLLRSLKAVLITKESTVMAVLGLLIVSNADKIKILVTSPKLEKSIIESSRKYFSYPEQLTRSRLLIRCLNETTRYSLLAPASPFTLSTSSLHCSFIPLSQLNPPYIQIDFGSQISIVSNKKIIFYTPSAQFGTQIQPEVEMKHFPHLLKEQKVQYIVLYRVVQSLMTELKTLPQPLRKKIILNRSEHKYNHRYFLTFEKNKVEHSTITDTEYLQLTTIKKFTLPGTRQALQFPQILEQVKFKQVKEMSEKQRKSCKYVTINKFQMASGWRLYKMGHQAQIEVGGQVVELIQGIIQIFDGEESKERVVIGGAKPETYKNLLKIRSLKNAKVRIILESDYHIYLSSPIQKYPISSSPLSTIPENSLITSLSRLQYQVLSDLCQSATYEVGLKTNIYNDYIYFISKGGMKWEDNDEVAGNGCFIGDLLSYYALKEQGEGKFQFDNYIQVIKDTWAVLVSLEEFHRFFLCRFPDVLNFIYRRGKIFH